MADLHSRAQDIMDLNEYNKEGMSMTYYDEKLKALQEKSVRFRQLSAMLSELRNQENDLKARVCQLEKIKLDEQADVDKLDPCDCTRCGRPRACGNPPRPASRRRYTIPRCCPRQRGSASGGSSPRGRAR